MLRGYSRKIVILLSCYNLAMKSKTYTKKLYREVVVFPLDEYKAFTSAVRRAKLPKSRFIRKAVAEYNRQFLPDDKA